MSLLLFVVSSTHFPYLISFSISVFDFGCRDI